MIIIMYNNHSYPYCARHYAKCFKYTILFMCTSHWQIRSWGAERLRNMPKVTQLISVSLGFKHRGLTAELGYPVTISSSWTSWGCAVPAQRDLFVLFNVQVLCMGCKPTTSALVLWGSPEASIHIYLRAFSKPQKPTRQQALPPTTTEWPSTKEVNP